MQHQNSKKQSQNTYSKSSNESSVRVDSVEKVLFRLKQLHEIEDESRNQLCPVFADEQSINCRSVAGRSVNSRNGSKHYVDNTRILKQLEQTDGIRYEMPLEQFEQAKLISELKIVNGKLKQDNIKLFAQCVKLRKKCQSFEHNQSYRNPFSKKNESSRLSFFSQQNKMKMQMLQEQLKKQRNKVYELELAFQQQQKLSEEKQKLCEEKQIQKLKLYQELQKKQSQCHQLNNFAKELSCKLTQKQKQLEKKHQQLQNLEKQFEILSLSRTTSKSSTMNNTTSQSRQEKQRDRIVSKDRERQRMMTNLKIVHQAQVRKLKGVIEQLKRQKGESSQRNKKI